MNKIDITQMATKDAQYDTTHIFFFSVKGKVYPTLLPTNSCEFKHIFAFAELNTNDTLQHFARNLHVVLTFYV